MKTYILKREQIVARSLREVFAFFERPEHLARIVPPSMAFEIITPGPIEMTKGAIFDYTVLLYGIRVRWTSFIAAFDPPHRFIDVQLQGPYSFWHHTHTFEDVPGGTAIRDEVRYILPMGVLGRMVHGVLVRPRLDHIFDYRSRIISNILDGQQDDSTNVHEEIN